MQLPLRSPTGTLPAGLLNELGHEIAQSADDAIRAAARRCLRRVVVMAASSRVLKLPRMAPDERTLAPANPQKLRTGLSRVWHATGYSMQGLRAGWYEPAFRQEAIASIVLLPAAFWLGRAWGEIALLAGSVLLVMIVELLNTALETAIDRIGPEWNHLSKRAKDMGSAAVLLAVLLCIGVWGAAIAARVSA